MNSAVQLAVNPVGAPKHDPELLEKLLQAVNKRYFKSRIKAEVIWEIPKGTVSVFTGVKGAQFSSGSAEHEQFESARKHMEASDFDSAIPLLMHCAEQNHPDSKLLLSHLFKRLNDNRWQHYAESYNRHFSTIRVVPPACYYPEQKTIAIHSHLFETNTPQYVLKYLLYHECCHQLIPCNNTTPHPDAFMEWEHRAPNRDRALDWLEHKGFPTLRTANDC